jgi:hypothetical protein
MHIVKAMYLKKPKRLIIWNGFSMFSTLRPPIGITVKAKTSSNGKEGTGQHCSGMIQPDVESPLNKTLPRHSVQQSNIVTIEEKPQIKAASDPHRSKIWKCVPTMDHPWIKATIFLLKKSSSQNKPLQLVIQMLPLMHTNRSNTTFKWVN